MTTITTTIVVSTWNNYLCTKSYVMSSIAFTWFRYSMSMGTRYEYRRAVVCVCVFCRLVCSSMCLSVVGCSTIETSTINQFTLLHFTGRLNANNSSSSYQVYLVYLVSGTGYLVDSGKENSLIRFSVCGFGFQYLFLFLSLLVWDFLVFVSTTIYECIL